MRPRTGRGRQKERTRQEMSHTLVQLLKTFKLRGEATLAGGVDDKDDLALKLGKIIDIALFCALLSVLLSRNHCRNSGSTNVLSRGLNSWKLVAEDMFAGDDTIAFLKLKKDLVAVLMYVGVKGARDEWKQAEDRGKTGFM